MKFETTCCRNSGCGNSFRKRRLAQRYCSERCRKAAYDRRAGRVSNDPRYVRRRQMKAQKSVGVPLQYGDGGNRRYFIQNAKHNGTLPRAILQSSLFPSPASWPIDIVGGKSGSNRLPRSLSDAILSTELPICEPESGGGL